MPLRPEVRVVPMGDAGEYFRPGPQSAGWAWHLGARLGPGPLGTGIAAVATVTLDLIEPPVGIRDELGRGPAVGREGRCSDRGGDRHRPALLAHERLVAECLEDALGCAACLRRVGVGQDHGELVAAIACGHVRRAEGRADQLGGPREHTVAEEVAERVVDELEVVKVEHQHAQRSLAALRPHDLLAHPLVQVAVVEEAGERITVGSFAGVLVQPRVLERHGGFVGHRAGELEALGVPADLGPREQLDQPDRLALRDERQHHEHPDPVASQELDLSLIGGWVLGVDDDGRLTLQDAEGLREADHVEIRLEDVERRVVAERFDAVRRDGPSS